MVLLGIPFSSVPDYGEIGLTEYEKRYKEIMIKNLHKKAKMLGIQIVE